MAYWRLVVLVTFLAGLALAGLVGTSASSTFVWPAYGLIGLAAALSIGLLFRRATFRLPRWSVLAVVVAGGYLLVRASDSPVAYFAREDAALVIVCFLAYGLFLQLFDSARARRGLVDGLAALVLLNLVFAFFQAAVRPSLWLLPGYERTFTDRPGGLFNHPDHFAGFLAMLVPVWLAMAVFSRRSRAVRWASAGLAAASAATALAVGGGVAGLALLAGGGIFAVLACWTVKGRLSLDTRKTLFATVAGLVAILAVGAMAANRPLARYLERGVLTKSGDLSLPQVWKSGWRQFQEAPLVGTGSRTTQVYGRQFRPAALGKESAEPEFAHNEFLQALADYGVVGLALLLGVLVVHFGGGLRFVRGYSKVAPVPGQSVPRSDHLALVLGAMASLGALCVVAGFDFVLHLPAFAVVAAMLLGVLAAPDPMAEALKAAPRRSPLVAAGGLHIAQRALVFGFGLAMTVFGAVFSRSEYHYEMARLAFEMDRGGFRHLPHLKAARALDPKNPFVFALSAHAQVSGILPEMQLPARRQALVQADAYFEKARELYPQDIFAAIGHAAVLDELERPGEALDRLREARKMAPLYGNLMQAEAEHYLRTGRIVEAEQSFADAYRANAFRNTEAARQGLATVTEWKLIAEQNGIDWRIAPDAIESEPLLAQPGSYRSMPEAKVAERDLAGQAPAEKGNQ